MYRLIQEDYLDDPWKVLVCCICLNRVTGTAAGPVIAKVLAIWPTPEKMQDAPISALLRLVTPLGFGEKRAFYLRQMSRQYLKASKPIEDVTKFYGCGQYAQDCWELLILKRKPKDIVTDKELRKYMVREGML